MATGNGDRVGVLVLRLWLEDAGSTPFRARITASGHVTLAHDDVPQSVVVGSAEEACSIVQAFIERFDTGA
jgi:hypothetical protein